VRSEYFCKQFTELVPCEENVGQNHTQRAVINSSKLRQIANFLKITLVNWHCNQEEIMSKLNLRECVVQFIRRLLSSLFAIQNYDYYRKIYGIIISPVSSYDFETWRLTLRQETRLRMSDKMLLQNIFGNWCEGTTGG
jgi:hypothetical protein